MTKKLRYRRASDYSVHEPEEFRRDLQQQDREIERTFRAAKEAQMWDSVRNVSQDATAEFGEMLVCDTADGDIVISLPLAKTARKDSVGKAILVVRISDSNVLTLSCVGPDDLINGASSQVLGASGGVQALVSFDGSAYWS